MAGGAGGRARLVYLLSRYGEAIERDLFDRGWDLADLWRRRRVRLLLNVIDGLPVNSAYVEAIADDDEAAEQAPKGEPAPPRLREWSPERSLLTDINERLGELIAVTAAAASGKPVRPPPAYPRPITAAERIARRRRREQHERLVQQLLPGKTQT
jgi:hypothetical protein